MIADQIVANLTSPSFPDAPSELAVKHLDTILRECERCRIQFPAIAVRLGSVRLHWRSPEREIKVVIDNDGDILFETSLKQLDEGGDVVNILSSDGAIESPRGLDRLLAWYLASDAASC